MATSDDISNPNLTTVPPPIFIDASTLSSTLTYKNLIHHFQTSLPTASSTMNSPIRQSHQTSPTSSLLLMPSWSLSPSLPYLGIKLVTHHPLNSSLHHLPGIHATFVLFNSLSGQPLASLDGTQLTLLRTASVSALASLYLSRQTSQTLLMVGAGSLSPHLIRAHLAVRPSINKVLIWNRTVEKAQSLVEKLGFESESGGVSFRVCEDLEEAVGLADVVSCATNSETALVAGAKLKEGAHLDLVGSFKRSMRECDEEAIKRGRVFVDNEAAVVEAGELVGAVERGEIVGNLVELIKREKVGRRDEKEITVFKSVGSAVVDLLSAQLVYETYIGNR